MLRFKTSDQRRPRNYLARREQYRLLALVAGLGAVILLIQQLSPLRGVRGQGSGVREEARGQRSGVGNAPADPVAVAVVVDRERLVGVRDNSHFRSEETGAWFYLFSLVRGHGRAIESAKAAEVTYTQLVAQPESYRGQLVRVRGEVKRIEAVAPAENDLGIGTLYRVMLKPVGRSPWPISVYCLRLPAGWSPGEPPRNQVDVTGLFFKNHSYAWQEGMALSPIIVADSFFVREAQALAVDVADPPAPVGKIVASAAAIAVAVVALVLWRTAAPATPVRDADTKVSDALRRLTREET